MPPLLRKALVASPLWPLLHPRRLHVYGVGAPKTGTVSIAELFSENYRSAHEAHIERTANLIERRNHAGLSDEELRGEVYKRDREWRLECESANCLVYLIDALVECFDEAKFILTVREPYPWLRSIIDHHINNSTGNSSGSLGSAWRKIRRENYGSLENCRYPAEEKLLSNSGAYPIDTYLSYWAYHNSAVLSTVPLEKLLIVETAEISNSVAEIAEFSGAEVGALAEKKSHSHKAPKRHGVFYEIEEDYVRAKIDEHCARVAERLRAAASAPKSSKKPIRQRRIC